MTWELGEVGKINRISEDIKHLINVLGKFQKVIFAKIYYFLDPWQELFVYSSLT